MLKDFGASSDWGKSGGQSSGEQSSRNGFVWLSDCVCTPRPEKCLSLCCVRYLIFHLSLLKLQSFAGGSAVSQLKVAVAFPSV